MESGPVLAPLFPPDSSGYRPGQSALDAVGQARQRCWKRAWVIDLDITGCFDTINHALLRRAVNKPAKERWVVLSIARWLKAPAQDAEGHLTAREQGTPPGGVVSPLRANRFLHDAFDGWMQRPYPPLPFERSAEEAMVHGRTEAEAQDVRAAMATRLHECRLERHPEKTTIVYCTEEDRRGTYPNERCDCLGETFRPRRSKHRWGKSCITCSPAVADQAGKAMRTARRHWKLPLRSDTSIEDLSRRFTPTIRGWLHSYGR